MPSRIIEIHRKSSFIEESNNDPDVKDYMALSFRAIGSYYKELGKVFASGLTREEEDMLMPTVLGGFNPVDDKYKFREKVQEFFKDINTKIPPEGMKLEVGLEQDGPLSEQNPPLRIMDYIKYRHALNHPQVGTNKDEAERYQHKLFYMVDKVAQTQGRSKLRDLEDKAQTEYLKINKDLSKVEMVLTLLGINTRGMSEDNMLLTLKDQASINPDTSDDMNTERLTRFTAVVNDKELTTKYDIMEMVRYEILERIKTKVLMKESGELIGENLREAVVWMMDKANSKLVNIMYSKLDELAKDRKIKHSSPHLSDKSSTKEPVASTSAVDTSDVKE